MARAILIKGDQGGRSAAAAFKRILYRSLNVLSPIGLLLLWEVLCRLRLLDVRFFPAPSTIVSTLVELLVSGEIIKHLGISLGRILLGFGAGAVPGLIIGLTMGLFPVVRASLEAVVYSLYPIPKLAIMPLVILVFGLGETSKIVIIAIGVFFQVLINTVAGVMNIDKIYLDVAKNLGARRWDFYWTVALPGAMPVIFAGLNVALGTAFLMIVAAEFVGARSGLGYLVWSSWQIMQVDVMYAGLIVLSLTGLLASYAMQALERVLVPWKGRS